MDNYSSITTLFIDLDDTIYPASSGVWGLIRQRIDQYMVEKLQYAQEQVSSVRQTLFQTYGTTMRGLQAIHTIDESDFLAYVHDVPIKDRIAKDLILRDVLLSYPQKKIILTNADSKHAQRVIEAVGLEGIFEAVIDIRAISPYCKPQPDAFALALRLSGESDPHRCILIDDSPRNLQSANAVGFVPILVQEAIKQTEPFPTISLLRDLPNVFNAIPSQ
jgi:putative hydrolase of the HAD superfamily